MAIGVPLAFTILGVLLFLLGRNGDVRRLAEITFFVGLFWLVGQLSGHALHF